MSELSLKNYLKNQDSIENQTVRSCCALGMKEISLKKLIMSPVIIHISDIHCTSAKKTWNKVDGMIVMDDQDSLDKTSKIIDILKRIKQTRLESNNDIVVITGDITDSGCTSDYMVAVNFITDIKNLGFDVYVVPGNHDYCWEGNLFFEDVFKAIKAINIAALAVEILLPGFIEGIIVAAFASVGIIVNPFDPIIIEIASKFSLSIFGITEISTDTVDNIERRKRFINYILSPLQLTDYRFPHIMPVENGYLILVDSMQGQLDGQTGDSFAQGDLGEYQFGKIQEALNNLKPEREQGKRITLCMHHSPFVTSEEPSQNGIVIRDTDLCLNQQERFLNIIKGNVDCLLHGHITPKGIDQRPSNTQSDKLIFSNAETNYKLPLINCENLEDMNQDDYYSVTMINPYAYQRVVYKTANLSVQPVRTSGHP